jgi:hypothetical protein
VTGGEREDVVDDVPLDEGTADGGVTPSAVEHPTRIIANAGNHLYRRFTVTTSSPTIRSVTCGSGPSGGA